MLNILTQLPERFLEARVDELHGLLGGPTLIHLPGRRVEPLFASVLLHGNEHTSFHAIQALLRKYRDRELPRALSIFVGNVEAARYGLRRLEQQPDYNRIWPGGDNTDAPEQRMMQAIVDEMRARRVFASVDVHNNTGLNPHYACVNRLGDRYFHLATLFSRVVVYFTRPKGVQTAAFAQLCPAVTVECGRSGDARSTEHALEFLEAALNLAEVPEHPIPEHDIDLFHTVATVKVPPEISFGFGEGDTDIVFEPDLDHMNFRELEEGTHLADIRPGSEVYLHAWDNEGRDIAHQFLSHDDNEIRLARPVMPSMLTLDTRVIRQDCLCYFMERYPIRGAEHKE